MKDEERTKKKENPQNYGSRCSIQEQNLTAEQNETSHLNTFERKRQVIWIPDNLNFAVDVM